MIYHSPCERLPQQAIREVRDTGTVFLLKPDTVRRNMVNLAVRRIIHAGYKILFTVRHRLSRQSAAVIYLRTFLRHYFSGADDRRARSLLDYMTSGDCISLAVLNTEDTSADRYSNAIRVRGVQWIPWKCEHESLRYELRDQAYDGINPRFDKYGIIQGEFPENICHTPEGYEELVTLLELINQSPRLEDRKN